MGEELKKKLFNVKKDGWEEADEAERKEIFDISEKYMEFLNQADFKHFFIDKNFVSIQNA